MPKKITVSSLSVVDVHRDTKQKIRLMASLEAQSIEDYLAYLINRAYEVALHNRGTFIKKQQKKHVKR